MPDSIPNHQNSLDRAWDIQEQAAGLGFDWPTIDGVFAKVEEELNEIKAAWAEGDREHAKRELGDLLFVAVNLARHLQANPHQELDRTNLRFTRRFNMVKEEVARRRKQIHECSIPELDLIWEQVKHALSTSDKK